mgnify:CR=1 FL=1
MTDEQPQLELETPSELVKDLFGVSFSAVELFADKLAAEGELRGLVGPRELPRLWSRHVVNCAALLPYLPRRGTVLDVGSGAGLPGIVIAAARPDLEVTLVEAMERRCEWLAEVSDELGLDNVQIINARSEDLGRSIRADVVTARAVASLDKLIRITSKLIAPHGRLLALKGQRAYTEVEQAAKELKRHHLDAQVYEVVSVMDGETTYVEECKRVAN